MMKLFLGFVIFTLWSTCFAQSQPAMVKSNNLKEVDIRIKKQRSGIRELAKKDIIRKEIGVLRSGRKPIRNNQQIRKRVQEKINKKEKRSKKENPVKKMVAKKKGKDKKLLKDRRFREKDTHISKRGVRGKTNRKARRPFRPLPPENNLP